jgi:succinate-semialdehyde dehydrogenase/glutarate-semialdehyde dehydrogenase
MALELISTNPANNKIIGRYKMHSDDQLNTFVDSADKTFSKWKKTTLNERSRLLFKLAEVLENHTEDAKLITEEMGKPIESAKGEILKCASLCRFYASNLEEYLREDKILEGDKNSSIVYCPLGALLGIMPWNFPYWQVIRFAVPAIAAGNTILLKHASNVSASALQLEKYFKLAGFPDHVYTAILATSEHMEAVIRNPKIHGVSLTGSFNAGSSVAKIAGEEVKPSLLELGGNDAYIILDDADLDLAVREGLTSRMKNAGQSCIGAKRFVVTEQVYDSFKEKLHQAMKAIQFGDPMDSKTTLGPLVSVDERDRLHALVKQSIEEGASVLLGASIPESEGAYYPPTLLEKIDASNIAYREELFGPICVLIKVKDEEEAILVANDSAFGLGAALFTQDIEKGKRLIIESLDAGAVFLNEFVKSDPRIAFGGIKKSGYGREMGEEGLKSFVNKKYIRY